MRVSAVPVLALGAVLAAAPSAADPDDPGPATPGYAPPFVENTQWVQWAAGQSSLRVYPTPAARAAARQLGTGSTAGLEAWSEVLAHAPEADTPGMREQFICHWEVAEVAEPGKISWNLEPWRPVVDPATMLGTGCNPGGPEEPF
ncbi:DUF2599 domain-containing protein [Mycobacterium shimoidei]|uniref:DUF2599 domain-containing protein n=1 Tax=Mycobacterium shimoidei TaxID=29313 RepID=A0A1E3TAB1_MYCSH|nr:DUF2599 domain-containing protein [Mycobacterium shimoidei]MCV7260395.1 DUF2599 domain-containing protein [Mycobacterium shimoidei]ODR11322.1 hypothetical protein BHQ16_18675 [Mycobacterium shimoidei]ORW78129.1 hypothetical protein AWC26_18075 [Mycobacterium shimoidei]SRX92301.1 hypothetical protein MSP7336_00526 [Mycobacterium shimoidei]